MDDQAPDLAAAPGSPTASLERASAVPPSPGEADGTTELRVGRLSAEPSRYRFDGLLVFRRPN